MSKNNLIVKENHFLNQVVGIMRKLVIISTVFLTLSGLLLHWWDIESDWVIPTASTLHIWVGMFFVVIFPLYAWDHIKTHKRRLKQISGVTLSGLSQLAVGVVLIVSGIVLLLFGTDRLLYSTEIHHYFTYPLIIALVWHFMSKK